MFYIILITTPYNADKYLGSSIGGSYHFVSNKYQAINFHETDLVQAQIQADRVGGFLIENGEQM